MNEWLVFSHVVVLLLGGTGGYLWGAKVKAAVVQAYEDELAHLKGKK